MNRKRTLQFGIGHLLLAMALVAAMTLTFSKSIFETRILVLALGLFCILCNVCTLMLHSMAGRSKRSSVMFTFFSSLSTMAFVWFVFCWQTPAWNGWITRDRMMGALLLIPIAACGAVTSAITLLMISRKATED